MNKQPHSKSFTQSTNFGTLGDKYVVIMVGLPCRGKSYTFAWYLICTWMLNFYIE